MTTEKRRQAARRSIRKAQRAWQDMSSRAHARAQPEGRRRAKPGSTGKGAYYHIEVRPKGQFTTFRTHDVGKKGGLMRVAGKNPSGSWDDQTWLVSKQHAHVEGRTLILDTTGVREVLEALGSKPVHVSGDRFRAKPRPNVPEASKPTSAQRRARGGNIKQAQAAGRAT